MRTPHELEPDRWLLPPRVVRGDRAVLRHQRHARRVAQDEPRARGGDPVAVRGKWPDHEPARRIGVGQRRQRVVTRRQSRRLGADLGRPQPLPGVLHQAPGDPPGGPEQQRRGQRRAIPAGGHAADGGRRELAGHGPQRVGPLAEPAEGEAAVRPGHRLADRPACLRGEQHARAERGLARPLHAAGDRAPLASQVQGDVRRRRADGRGLGRGKPRRLDQDPVGPRGQVLDREAPVEVGRGVAGLPAAGAAVGDGEGEHAGVGDRVGTIVEHATFQPGRGRRRGGDLRLGPGAAPVPPAGAAARRQERRQRDEDELSRGAARACEFHRPVLKVRAFRRDLKWQRSAKSAASSVG